MKKRNEGPASFWGKSSVLEKRCGEDISERPGDQGRLLPRHQVGWPNTGEEAKK